LELITGITHPCGPGKLKHLSCSVEFNAFVPHDIKSMPYFVWFSKGSHSHPPPPPTRPPPEIMKGVIEVIKQSNNPHMTLSKWFRIIS
jgi:hypothetical protein